MRFLGDNGNISSTSHHQSLTNCPQFLVCRHSCLVGPSLLAPGGNRQTSGRRGSHNCNPNCAKLTDSPHRQFPFHPKSSKVPLLCRTARNRATPALGSVTCPFCFLQILRQAGACHASLFTCASEGKKSAPEELDLIKIKIKSRGRGTGCLGDFLRLKMLLGQL